MVEHLKSVLDNASVAGYCPDRENPYERMEIGYITRKHTALSRPGEQYIREIERYLGIRETPDEAEASRPCSGNPTQKTA